MYLLIIIDGSWFLAMVSCDTYSYISILYGFNEYLWWFWLIHGLPVPVILWSIELSNSPWLGSSNWRVGHGASPLQVFTGIPFHGPRITTESLRKKSSTAWNTLRSLESSGILGPSLGRLIQNWVISWTKCRSTWVPSCQMLRNSLL